MKSLLAIALFAASIEVTEAQELSLFGLRLDSSLAVAPVCEKPSGVTGPCIHLYSKTATKSGIDRYITRIPTNAPKYLKSADVSVLGDSIAGVHLITSGAGGHSAAWDDLTAKFGPPAKNEVDTVHLRSGAPIPRYRAMWVFNGATLRYTSMSVTIDNGTIDLETTDYKRRFIDEERRESASHPKM